MLIRFAWLQFILLAMHLCLGGCASKRGPQVLAIPSDRYAAAFDAASEAARSEGLTPTLRDRRNGVIDTQPHVAGSMVEPWRIDNATLGQSIENTVAFQRRRARFEFSKAGAFESQPQSNDGGLAPAVDLTEAAGELELRVWVYVERAETPGVRRDTWSRRMTTTAVLVHPEKDTGTYWRSIARDEEYERRLLAAVEKALR